MELPWLMRTLDTMKFTMMMEKTTVFLVDGVDTLEVPVCKGNRKKTSL